MSDPATSPSARQQELLELAYAYALEQGLVDLSLRPLAAAIGSSPRVLLYLFGSKDGLVRALLARARVDELALLDDLDSGDAPERLGLLAAAERLWAWLSAEDHRALLRLWAEGYVRSLVEPDGPWAGFAEATVRDWLAVLDGRRDEAGDGGAERRTYVLAVLRGGLLDLLATGDTARVTDAVLRALEFRL
ncbi:MAG TPA: TetR/AcrR family transcriptional regulator [Marmoricola sp.]|jgi:AcrR family transcriptional regulator|nr:TetR/AcrR family transcriptional regulator [Marmoricola sp.]